VKKPWITAIWSKSMEYKILHEAHIALGYRISRKMYGKNIISYISLI
jgi:hypothetical protein